MNPADFEGLLRSFLKAEVRFVVIGGVGAALQGVTAQTYDLDLVLDPEAQNLERALGVLDELDACLRQHLPGKTLRATRLDLEAHGAILMMTSLGPLDLLGRVATGWGHSELLERSIRIELDERTGIQVLDLAALIEIKERVGREKDLAVLPLYRRTLAERDS
ncbi:MAG: hypothetical protein ACI8QS_000234 [Planctomycetota bacterium]|jgi:hypothetical protein